MAHPYNAVTPDDVALANRTVLTRASAVARIAGIVAIVIGVVGFAAWLWLVVRTQQQLSEQGGGVDQFGQPAPTIGFRERVDQSIGSVQILLWATITIGGGFALRLLGQHSLARAGGSLTGYEVGDVVPAIETETETPMAAASPSDTEPGDASMVGPEDTGGTSER